MANNRYGSAIPIPIEKKIRNVAQAGWVKANAEAVPRKGAVQGVARIVANAPWKKAPPYPPPPRHLPNPPCCGSRYRKLENTKQVQGKCKYQTGNRQHEPIVLELESPADLRANSSKESNDAGEDRETAKDA